MVTPVSRRLSVPVVSVLVAVLLLAVIPGPATARQNPYFREQCETGFITWSTYGGREKAAQRAMRWVKRHFTSYEFRRVPEYWDPMISIQMNAHRGRGGPRYMGATYLWQRRGQIDAAEIEIYMKHRDREAVFLVTLHEILHGMGIPHYEKSLSLMNAIGLSAVYPVDKRLAADQNALCGRRH